MTYHVQFLLLVLAGWVNRQQQDVIDYLREENRVLRGGVLRKKSIQRYAIFFFADHNGELLPKSDILESQLATSLEGPAEFEEGHGVIHGGLIGLLADTEGNFAVGSVSSGSTVKTVEFKLSLLADHRSHPDGNSKGPPSVIWC